MAGDQRNLVVLYVSALGNNAVETYAAYIVGSTPFLFQENKLVHLAGVREAGVDGLTHSTFGNAIDGARERLMWISQVDPNGRVGQRTEAKTLSSASTRKTSEARTGKS